MLKVVIIGGVAAGMSAASKLKRNLGNDVRIVVYERGGNVSYGACGIPFYVSGMVDKPENLIVRSAEQFREKGIDVLLHHEVIAVDTTAKNVFVKNIGTGEEFAEGYDKLVIASGAGVNIFSPFQESKTNLLWVRDLKDASNLRAALESPEVENVAVIGAGFIGLEIAESCRKHNKNVTIIESASRVLTAMDEEFSEKLELELKDNDIVLKKNSVVTALESEGDKVKSISLANGEKQEKLTVQLVVCCIGVTPCTDFIDNVNKYRNGAIKVDKNMRTSQPDVFAAGDCSIMRSFVTGKWHYMSLGTNANKQGRIIADVIAGKPAPVFKLIGSTALRLFRYDAAKVGLSEQEAKELKISYKTTLVTGNSFASYFDDKKVTIKLIYEPDTKKILGAQLFGRGIVVPRANYYAIAIANEMSADEFGFMDLCYSPPFSGVWDVSLIAANTCK